MTVPLSPLPLCFDPRGLSRFPCCSSRDGSGLWTCERCGVQQHRDCETPRSPVVESGEALCFSCAESDAESHLAHLLSNGGASLDEREASGRFLKEGR